VLPYPTLMNSSLSSDAFLREGIADGGSNKNARSVIKAEEFCGRCQAVVRILFGLRAC
jgi:hypothetical protein